MTTDDDLITRQELADTLDKGKSTIRRWEKSGILKPIINEHGVHRFRVGDVRHLIGDLPIVRLQQAKPHVPSGANASGEMAAAIFGRLERGEGVAKIVTELRVHPDVVMGIGATWNRVSKGHFLRSRHILAIASALRIAPSRDPEEFIERIKAALGRLSTVCTKCRQLRPRYCHPCAIRESASRSSRPRASTPPEVANGAPRPSEVQPPKMPAGGEDREMPEHQTNGQQGHHSAAPGSAKST